MGHAVSAPSAAGAPAVTAILRGRTSSALGTRTLEHALVEARPDLVRLDALRQGDVALEVAVRPLEAVVAALLHRLLEPPLALEGEHVVVDLDLDVVGVEAGQLGAQHDGLVRVEDVHRRRPRGAGGDPVADGAR